MKVYWFLPDQSTSEIEVLDIEQLLFLLRLVNRVVLKGVLYEVNGSELIVEDDQLSVAVNLKELNA